MKRNDALSILLLLPILLIASGCETVAKFEEAATGSGGTTSSSINFSGISSVDQKTDTTLRLNWSAHADAVAYDVYNTTSGTPVWLQTVNGQASSSVSLASLNPNQLYKFRVRALDSEGNRDSNTNDVSATMNLAPDTPNGLTRTLPVSSPGFSLPTIRVSGVKNGDTIKLFTDNTCSTQVASGTASGSTIDLTPSSLSSGTVDFYATATNAFATASGCSTATASYDKLTCPTANGDYLAVTANPTVGTTSEFCVAQYEMKDVGGVATSQATGNPWVSINQINSRTACSNLGAGYGLISNEEWMTIAREIEMTDANWSNGTIGDGHLNRGWSASTGSDGFQNSAVAPSTGAGCIYNTAANTCGSTGDHKLKRTHTLSNGEIWDFAGNVWEWVDWNVTPANKAYISADTVPVQAWREWTVVDTNINNGDEMETITWQTTDPSLNSLQNTGQYYAGLNSSGGAALRGGFWGNGTSAGAFALNLNIASTNTNTSVGFRCVFRP